MHLETGEARRSQLVKIGEARVSMACERQRVGTTTATRAQGALFDNRRLGLALRSSLRLEARLR
jgi:hypothetical protein